MQLVMDAYLAFPCLCLALNWKGGLKRNLSVIKLLIKSWPFGAYYYRSHHLAFGLSLEIVIWLPTSHWFIPGWLPGLFIIDERLVFWVDCFQVLRSKIYFYIWSESLNIQPFHEFPALCYGSMSSSLPLLWILAKTADKNPDNFKLSPTSQSLHMPLAWLTPSQSSCLSINVISLDSLSKESI